MPDLYQTLGVSRTASQDELKVAYRKLAKKLHPDLNPGRKDIETKFKEVTAAYDLLSDPDKRAQYDRGEVDAMGNNKGTGGGYSRGGADPFGGANSRGGFAGASQTRAGTGGGDAFGGFSEDLFADLFGVGRKRGSSGNAGYDRPRTKGADITYALSVGFIDACLGTKHRVTLSSGKVIDVNIPPGTEDGSKLRLKGQGQSSLGEAGDAIVEIAVQPHGYFSKKGNDIYLDAPVSLPEAVLGANIKVPTLEGSVATKIPPNSNTGTLLRLKGKGVPPHQGQPAGDFFVRLKIVLPDGGDRDISDFIERWSRRHSYDPREKLGWDK